MAFVFNPGLQAQAEFLAQTDDVMKIEMALCSVLNGYADRFLSSVPVINGPCTIVLFFPTDAGELKLGENEQSPRGLSIALFDNLYHHELDYPARLSNCATRGVRISKVSLCGVPTALVSTAWIK